VPKRSGYAKNPTGLRGPSTWLLRHARSSHTAGDGRDLVKCSFCGLEQSEVKRLMAGPGVCICDECVDVGHNVFEEETRSGPCDAAVNCSFCGKAGNQVKEMIGGPGVYICDECVRGFHNLIAEIES